VPLLIVRLPVPNSPMVRLLEFVQLPPFTFTPCRCCQWRIP
jgi:hypothetical protein